MVRQQAEFVAGAMKTGVPREEAAYIFELVDKFAGYGFNKAHTAAYAHVAYYTAYLKANYREEFLAASITLDAGNTDKLSMYAAEAKKSGTPSSRPASTPGGRFRRRKTIRYSLAALKNIGALAVGSIVEERTANGPFMTSDFAGRCNTKALNKRALRRWQRPAPDALSPTGPPCTATSSRCWRSPTGRRRTRQGTTICSGRGAAVRPQIDIRALKA